MSVNHYCLICHENSIKPKLPTFCDCKVYFHKDCLEECFKFQLFCPICRIDKAKILDNINNIKLIKNDWTDYTMNKYILKD